MPTSAIHITVAERVAMSNAAMKALLGDPHADPNSIEGAKMRYAKLGACGPDIFYAMADYGGELQDLENFLVKVAGSVEVITSLTGEISRYVHDVVNTITMGVVEEIEKTIGLFSAIFTEGVMALIVGPVGFNFWPVFEAARQRDLPRENWFWADYLHYIKTGTFVRKLIENARASGSANLLAYAYGYLTHYVTDVVGHPFVNQVVQAPWRLYWQRHHTVENYMDAYYWDRWHQTTPEPPGFSGHEPPLDTLLSSPNPSIGSGAPLTFARLNDHVNIGNPTLGDPVDDIIKGVADSIRNGLDSLGFAEFIEPADPAEPDFVSWTELMSNTMKDVYVSTAPVGRIPNNLGRLPTPDDVAGAYGVFRLVLRMLSEEKIQPPVPPNIISDISDAVKKLGDDIAADLAGFPPFPSPSGGGGGFSWSSFWDAVKHIAEWVGEVVTQAIKTAIDAIKDLIIIAATVVTDVIKYLLYIIQCGLFAIYNAFRDVLVHAGYAVPFTGSLNDDLGNGHSARDMWCSRGNLKGRYPIEEISKERDRIFTDYTPIAPPIEQPEVLDASGKLIIENQHIDFAAPYEIAHEQRDITPDRFIDADLGPDDMFKDQEWPTITTSPREFIVKRRDFGGAIANCVRGIEYSESNFPDRTGLPDYNMDGDRGYGWPCWDIKDQTDVNNVSHGTLFVSSDIGHTTTSLRPEAVDSSVSGDDNRHATVQPVLAQN